MNDEIRFTYDRVPPALYWRAARAAANPPRPGWRLGGTGSMVAIWLVAFVIMMLLLRLPIVAAGGPAFLAGLAVMYAAVAACGWVNRRRLSSVLKAEQTGRGPVTVRIGPDGCHFASAFGESRIDWTAVDEVIDLKDGTGLRVGLLVYPLPDAGLPADLTPPEFRDRMEQLRQAV